MTIFASRQIGTSELIWAHTTCFQLFLWLLKISWSVVKRSCVNRIHHMYAYYSAKNVGKCHKNQKLSKIWKNSTLSVDFEPIIMAPIWWLVVVDVPIKFRKLFWHFFLFPKNFSWFKNEFENSVHIPNFQLSFADFWASDGPLSMCHIGPNVGHNPKIYWFLSQNKLFLI